MRRNLLQTEVREQILSRINRLTPQTQRQWGKMNVNQMLYHTSSGLRIAYGEMTTAPRGNWLKKKLMRFVILKTDVPTPKEKAETFPEMNTVARSINPADFNVERNKLIELLNDFPTKQTAPLSGLLGKMSKENWARLQYSHLDHHLKQFGV